MLSSPLQLLVTELRDCVMLRDLLAYAVAWKSDGEASGVFRPCTCFGGMFTNYTWVSWLLLRNFVRGYRYMRTAVHVTICRPGYGGAFSCACLE